ncbi:MAG: TRAP transporter small permease [Spirochaetales bacterium]|nr:TRAP transporter small permease [Spirochaetales bacterium]
MQKARLLKRSGSFVLDLIEVYIPSITFILLFVAFLLQIFYRYFLVPLTWPLELTLLCFIWTALLGGLYAKRDNSHVQFTIVYDMVKPKTQLWMRLIGNFMLFVSFCIALYPSYDYVVFMAYKKSNVMKIPMNLAYSPFVVFLVFMIGRLGYDLFIDFKKLTKGEV